MSGCVDKIMGDEQGYSRYRTGQLISTIEQMPVEEQKALHLLAAPRGKQDTWHKLATNDEYKGDNIRSESLLEVSVLLEERSVVENDL